MLLFCCCCCCILSGSIFASHSPFVAAAGIRCGSGYRRSIATRSLRHLFEYICEHSCECVWWCACVHLVVRIGWAAKWEYWLVVELGSFVRCGFVGRRRFGGGQFRCFGSLILLDRGAPQRALDNAIRALLVYLEHPGVLPLLGIRHFLDAIRVVSYPGL